ncbi:MAG: hypothetical protein U5J63_13195 [Fodinibius sp.]|nr:hypothetical protein [Fodinibius sp.]
MQAKQEAEKEGKKIVEDYFEDNEDAYEWTEKNPRLSDFLETEYWPYVESNCSAADV